MHRWSLDHGCYGAGMETISACERGKGCFQILCVLARIKPHSRQCKQLFGDYLRQLVEHREIRVRVKAASLLRELEFARETLQV